MGVPRDAFRRSLEPLYTYLDTYLAGLGIVPGGNLIFVNPNTSAAVGPIGIGDDTSGDGSIDMPFASVDAAHDAATANQHDTVVLVSASNTASATTSRTATGGIAWSKSETHLVGLCSGNHAQQRARISPQTTDITTEIPLLITGHDCRFANFSVFHGVNGWTRGTGEGGGVPAAVKVGGQRNAFFNVTMSGLGDSTGANSMDVDGGSSLWLAESENLFDHCYIGLETVPLGASGLATVMQVSGAVSRNKFVDSIFSMRASAAGARCIELAASAVQDMGMYFDRCGFTNSGIFTGGAASTGVFEISATQNGGILLNGSTCYAIGFTFWEEAAVSGKLYISNPAVGAGKAGLGTVAVGS